MWTENKNKNVSTIETTVNEKNYMSNPHVFAPLPSLRGISNFSKLKMFNARKNKNNRQDQEIQEFF